MFPHQTKGVKVSDDGIESGSGASSEKKETIVEQMKRLQVEQVRQREAQESLRIFLHRTKIAARQVRSVTARPGIAPKPEALIGKSRTDADALRSQYLNNAIEAIRKQKDDVSGLVNAYIARVKKLSEDGSNITIDWNNPAARAKLTEVVVNMVADMWEGDKEDDYKGRFMDFIEFAARLYDKDDPGYQQYMTNADADRFLTTHNAFLSVDASLATLHPMTPGSIFSGALPGYRLLFGKYADATSMDRTMFILDEVIYPHVGRCCDNVQAAIPEEVKLTQKDKHIMFRSMINLVTKDADAIIRHEGILLLNWIKSIPKESREDFLQGDGAFKSWLNTRLEQRLEQFYPNPTNFFDQQSVQVQAGADSNIGQSALETQRGDAVRGSQQTHHANSVKPS